MNLVPIEDTYDLMRECFPDVDLKSLIEFHDQFIAFMLQPVCGCLLYPYETGIAISYMGVAGVFRGRGFASHMLRFVDRISGAKPLYGEVIPDSVMYHILLKKGWYRVPISYVCPAWGSEPADSTRCLMCSKKGADHLAFIREFYAKGYRVREDGLIAKYRNELSANASATG